MFGRVDPNYSERLLDQDIIFVGGGNTRSMLALWREWRIDDILRQAYEKGIILAGVSAGAICWFQEGVTDSVWPLVKVQGLGFLEGGCCPHYDSESERRPFFLDKIYTGEIASGIGLQDKTAAHYIDGKLCRVLSWGKLKKAYEVGPNGEKELKAEVIPTDY